MDTETTTSSARRAMRHEARRLIDVARERGIVLRLLGGLAVREHCTVTDFCERDYADLDLIGQSGQVKGIAALMADLGYREEAHVALATGSAQRQFARACDHLGDDGRPVHEDDRVDIFLDAFHMDHEIGLSDRLALGAYTISATDILLTKLQMARLNEKDVRDIITLLKDVDMADTDGPGVVDVGVIAQRCAQDWGLYHDVTASLTLCEELADGYDLDEAARDRVRARIGRLRAALDAAPKPLAWRVRAKVGTRMPWHDEVEEQGA
jgi:hypothetical protein